MNTTRILIVEDEILIADTIGRYLVQHGYEVAGHAVSLAEAESLYLRGNPDLVLLDIRLNGPGTGIDVAHFIRRQPRPAPFIYLTSQLDRRSIDLAKDTWPAGYLSKPIQKESLYTTIEIALHAHAAREPEPAAVTLHDGVSNRKVVLDDILYLQADHVYVRVHVDGAGEILQRRSLTELLEDLPGEQFVQTHRSYAVNVRRVSGWDGQCVHIGERVVPLSRSRRKEVLGRLGAE